VDWFSRLSRRRGSNGFGVSPLSFETISAWDKLCNEGIEPWEVRVLELLDDVHLAEISKKAN